MTYNELEKRVYDGEVVALDISPSYESQFLEGMYPTQFIKSNHHLFRNFVVQTDEPASLLWIFSPLLKKEYANDH